MVWTKIKIGARQKIDGYITVDIDPLTQPDIVCDVCEMPKTWEDSFDELIIEHVLEHVPNTLAAFNEIYRVMKNNAIVKVSVPHAKNPDFWGTPDHVKPFIPLTFKQLRKYNGYTFDFEPLSIRTEWVWNIRHFPFRHPNQIFAELKVLK